MSVYVDEAKHTYGRMIMCHMIADSTEELLAMASKIGVQAKWLQYGGTYKEHFDICKAKRKLALEAGAEELTGRALALEMMRKKEGGQMKYPNIIEVTLSMASTHGMFSRLVTKEMLVAAAMTAVEAEGVCTSDVTSLEHWLSTLDEEQKLILVDGEEEEMSALIADSPMGEAGFCVGQLIDDIYEALEAM